GGTLSTARILLVDDTPANLVLLRRILSGAGYGNVRETEDPEGALQLTREWEPDLIVLDLHMPRLDGVRFLELLRSREAGWEFLPVLVLTADTTHDALKSALAAGANDFATKPFDAHEVLLRVRNLLSVR